MIKINNTTGLISSSIFFCFNIIKQKPLGKNIYLIYNREREKIYYS